MEANSKDTTDIHPKHVDLKDIDPKDVDPKDIDSKDVDPKDMDPKDIDHKDIDPKDINLPDIDPKDIDARDNDPKDVDPKNIDPKDIDPKDFDLMLDSEQGMGEDRRREMLCHWAAATCHMTPRMWWVCHHLQDSDQELTQLEPAGESGSRQGWCK